MADVNCGSCGRQICHANRKLHTQCFPRHRRADLKALDPLRCTVIQEDEDGERCPKPKIAHDWCQRHHMRWNRTGDPLGNRSKVGKPELCVLCLPEGERRPVAGYGMCRRHYSRWERHGDPLWEGHRQRFTYTDNPEADFWALVDTQGGNREVCWPWRGTITVNGYGTWQHAVAHRYAYILERGPIPDKDEDGYRIVLDHTCHDPQVCRVWADCPHRRCVNPWHLKPVREAENTSAERSSNGRPKKDGCTTCETHGMYRPYIVDDPVHGLLCAGHYQRNKKHGDVFAEIPLGAVRGPGRRLAAAAVRHGVGHPATPLDGVAVGRKPEG